MPGEPIKSFKVNGSVYDIPESKVKSFLKDMPNAEEVVSYKENGNTYDIPPSDTASFKKDMPDATMIYSQPQSLDQAVDQDNAAGKEELAKTATLQYMANNPPPEGYKAYEQIMNLPEEPRHGVDKVLDQAIKPVKALEYLQNKIIKGATNLLSGAANNVNDMMANAPVPSYQPIGGNGQTVQDIQQQQQEDQAIGRRNAATIQHVRSKVNDFVMSPDHEELEKKVEGMKGIGGTALRTLGGFAEFLPSVAAAPATGGASLFFGGYQDGLDQVAGNDKIDPKLKPLYALGYGAVNTALMSLPISHALDKVLVDKIASRITIQGLDNAIQATDGKMTGQAFMDAINNAKQDALNKIKIGGIKAAKGFAEGTVFSTGQQAANVGMQHGINSLEGKQVFETPDLKQFIENVGSGALSIGMLNFGMGGFHTRSKDYIKDLVAKAKSPEDLANIHGQVDALAQKGKIAPDHADELHQAINTYATIKKTLPPEMTPEQGAKAFDLITDRDAMKEHSQALDKQKEMAENGFDATGNPIDPALKDIAVQNLDKEITNAHAAIDAKNDEIREAATGLAYKYSKKDGAYTKQLGDNQPEEISAELYELKTANKEAQKKQGNPEAGNPSSEVEAPAEKTTEPEQVPTVEKPASVHIELPKAEKPEPVKNEKITVKEPSASPNEVQENEKIHVETPAPKFNQPKESKITVQLPKEKGVSKETTPEPKPKGGQNAIQIEKPDEGVLRNEGVPREGELPGVGSQNKEPEKTAAASEKKEVTSTPLKIYDHESDNKHAEGKLSKEDNPEQEPTVAGVESTARDAEKAPELEKGIEKTHELQDAALDVKRLPVSDIHTNEKKFQGRERLNDKAVKRIAENWSDADQDPIQIWKDPKDGKYYVLSGHHRLAAAKLAGRSDIKVIDRSGDFNEKQARQFATEEANANRTMETPLERARTLRKKRDEGADKKETKAFLEREGKNARFVDNISRLSPEGKAMQMLHAVEDSPDKTTQKEAEKVADWIGEARKSNSVFTDVHENEMFDFLMDKNASKRITTKSDFIHKATAALNRLDPTEPLNLKRFRYKNQGEETYEKERADIVKEINNRQDKINDLKARFTNPERDDYVRTADPEYGDMKKVADQKIASLNAEIKGFQKKLQDLMGKKQEYTSGGGQGSLFGKKQKVARPAKSTGEHYSEVAGSKPVDPSNGIKSEPIIGEQPKHLSQIAKDLVDGLNMKIRKIKPESRSAGAAYRPGDAGIITRLGRNLKYAAHETGHFLDDKFGLLTNILKSGDKQLMNELREFSEMEMGSQPPDHVSSAQKFKYHMQEGFAEWLRNYIAAPDATAKRAPNIYKLFKSLPDDVQKVIDQFSRDYRTFEGATAYDRTMASVKMEPDKAPGLLGRLFKAKKEDPGFKINWVDNLAANWVDPLQAFNKASKYLQGIRGLDEVLPENDPYLLARLFLSVDRKFGEALDKGLRDGKGEFYHDANGDKITLNSLLKHFDNTDEATLKREMGMAVHHMISQRVLELKDRFNRSDLISGVGGGIVTDLKNAEQGIKEFQELPKETQARLNKAIDAYRDFADASLRYMVDMGRLSKDQYKTIKDNNLYYVAFNRIRDIGPDEEIAVFNNGGGGGRIGVVKQPIHKIRGSESEIQNPYLSLMDNYHRALKEADRNKIMLAFRDLMITHRGMHGGEPIPVSNIGTKGESPNSIPIFVNGKAEHWTFEPELYKSIKGINEVGGNLGWPLETLAKLPAALRASIVYFPAFQLRNITRDTFDSFVKSTTGKSFKHFFKGSKQDWDDIAAMGGLNAGYYAHSPEAYYAHMKDALSKISKDKKFILVNGGKLKRAFHKYEHFMEKGETLNRVSEYRSAYAKAKDKLGYDNYNAMLYAAFHARDLMDFAVMGYQMRVVNKFVPFSNAALQGVRSGVKSAVENPGRFALRMAVNTVLPQIAVWLWNHKDAESAKRYEELPAYQRDLFWNIGIGGQYVTIPKPYELGMAAAAIDRGLSKVFGYNNDAYRGYAGQVIEAMSPIGDMGALAGPLAPFVEVAANKDFFRDKHIISVYEENIPIDERKNDYASRIGKAIQKVAPIDARDVDFLLQSTLGYYGNEALKVSNIGSDKSSNKPSIKDVGFFKDYPAYNSNSVQDLVNYANEHMKTSTKEYKKFRAITTMYFSAKTTGERNQLADDMIDYSKELLSEWKSGKSKKSHRIVIHP